AGNNFLGAIAFTNPTNFADVSISNTANAVLPTLTTLTNLHDLTFNYSTVTTPALPTLTTFGNLHDVTFTFAAATSLQLQQMTLNNSGNLSVTSNGPITQAGGAITVPGTATFVVGSSNNITLDTFNNLFNSVAITSGNNVLLKDADA